MRVDVAAGGQGRGDVFGVKRDRCGDQNRVERRPRQHLLDGRIPLEVSTGHRRDDRINVPRIEIAGCNQTRARVIEQPHQSAKDPLRDDPTSHRADLWKRRHLTETVPGQDTTSARDSHEPRTPSERR